MSDILIRPAVVRDLEEIVDLWQLLQVVNARYEERLTMSEGARVWFADHIRDQIETNARFVLVAVAENCVAGYAYGQVLRRPTLAGGDCGYVADLCVRDGYRGQGIGRRLFHELRTAFVEHGLLSLEVQVVRANPASQAFWRKMGFIDFLRTLRCDIV